ncbi:MAG: FtsX-like permease family protein [Pseudomonadota bacterium]
MNTTAMAFKNLKRNRSRNLMQGALIFFAAFMISYFAQFLAGITKNFTSNLVELATGDVYLSSTINADTEQNSFDRDYEYLRIPADFIADIKANPEVKAVNPRLEFPVRLSLPNDTLAFLMSAFDVKEERRLRENFQIIEGRMLADDGFEIIVPVDMARQQNIRIGDQISVLAGTVDHKANLLQLKVVGTFKTYSLSTWLNNYIYTSLTTARVLVDDAAAVTRLNIHLQEKADPEMFATSLANPIKEKLLANNPPLDATSWKKGAAFFTSLIFGIEAGFFIIIGMICTILSCAIGFSIMMGVVERKKEIATLGALGASPKMIRKMFMTESILLSDIAAFSGIVLAAILFYFTLQSGVPINNPELEGFLGASHFYPALDIAGFIVPFIICKVVSANVSFLIANHASKRPIAAVMVEN